MKYDIYDIIHLKSLVIKRKCFKEMSINHKWRVINYTQRGALLGAVYSIGRGYPNYNYMRGRRLLKYYNIRRKTNYEI